MGIVEHFDESLVLLKRLMCWRFSDVVYVRNLVANYSHTTYKKRPTTKLTIQDAHRRWDWVDYKLYEHFNASLWRRIYEEGPGFHKEVKAFRAAHERVGQYCTAVASLKDRHNVPEYLNETKVAQSEWSDEFSITP